MKVPPPAMRARRLALAVALGVGIGAVSSRHIASAGYCDSPSAATVSVSDPTPGAQPDITFTYTVNTARGDHDVLFWANKPTGVGISDRTGVQVGAQATVKVNDVTKSPGIVWTGNSMVDNGYSLLLINLETGYSLSVGDKVEVTFPSGIITNPSSATDVTWVWRTSTSSGYDEECYTHTLSIATTTTSSSTTSSTSTTSTTEPSTSTSTTEGTTTSGTDLVTMASPGTPSDGDLASTGGRSDLWTLMAVALVLVGIVATNGRIVRDEA